MDRAPTFENVHFKSMLDDYLNFQTTLLFVMTVKGTTLTMVHPHTSDQPDDFGDNGEDIVDLWYGTTEPLSRVRAGETLIFYDPVCYSLRHPETFLPPCLKGKLLWSGGLHGDGEGCDQVCRGAAEPGDRSEQHAGQAGRRAVRGHQGGAGVQAQLTAAVRAV